MKQRVDKSNGIIDKKQGSKRAEAKLRGSPFLALIISGLILAAAQAAGQPDAHFAPVQAPAVKIPVTTYHYDNLRTGWNSQETVLSPQTVSWTSFGLLTAVGLDDQVDAQPLLVPNLFIAGGMHDAVYVATESNSVYALDASTGAILLQRNLGLPVQTPLGCWNNGPNVGITSTPVIDPDTQTLYVMAYVAGSPPQYQLHALSLTSLADKVPPATVAGSHLLSDGVTRFAFNAVYQRQRPGLIAQNGNIYAAFGSFCDQGGTNSRGWVFGWNAANLAALPMNQLENTLAYPPAGFALSSIWMSGFAVAGSGSHLYFVTGNSDCNWLAVPEQCPPQTTYDGKTNIQESVVRVTGDLANVAGVYAPGMPVTKSLVFAMDLLDSELGSGGVMLINPVNPANPLLAVVSGKWGNLILLRREISGALTPVDWKNIGGCWCGPSFFRGPDGIDRVVTSNGSSVQTWMVQYQPWPALGPEASASIATGQDPGFFTAISSNGTAPGSAIIWALGRPTDPNTNNLTLYAFSATPAWSANGLTFPLLFQAPAGSWPWAAGSNSNAVPVVANGKVYVASAYLEPGTSKTRGLLAIFGLRGANAAPAAAVAAIPLSPLATPDVPHIVSGKVQEISGSTLILTTREGKTVTVDASQAIKEKKVGAPLRVGAPVSALGASLNAAGALEAAVILRPKGTSGTFWPADR